MRLHAWVAASLLATVSPVALTAAGLDEATLSYRLQPGDTLIGIGQRLLHEPADWRQLQRLNRVQDTRRMRVGSELQIPLRLLRGEPAAAAVLAVRGSVSGAVVGQAVAEGSDISTAGDGQVLLRLVDGTTLRLRADSRLRIDESRRLSPTEGTRSGVRLEQGRVEIKAQPVRGGLPGFRIDTPQGVLGVRGTEFRVASSDGLTRGEVLEGVVAVGGASTAAEVRVAAEQGTVVDAGGRVAPARPLLPPPSLAAWPAVHERPLVRLQMPALAAARSWRVQIGRDAQFDELLVDQQSSTPEVRIAGLEDGRYPMRVRAIDEQGLEGRDAVSTLVLKARPEPPLPRTPTAQAVIGGTRADFAWTASSEAARYRLQVGRADAAAPFEPPLRDSRDLPAPELALDGLAPGAYLWRLASVRADGDQGPFGDAQPFEMRALPPMPSAPGAPTVSDDSLQLSWAAGLPGQRFDMQLARDAAFTQIVAERTTDVARVEMPRPGAGRFYVRVRVRDADGYVGPWSAAQHFDLVACVRNDGQACWQVDGGRLTLQ